MKQKLTTAFAALALFAGLASAQTVTGTISGSVSDPSGAAVANAKVTAMNVDTNVTFPATTNQTGIYRVLYLPVGNYNVLVETAGFKKFTAGPFKLEVNQIARVDVKLEVGDLTQTVEVKDFAPLLQTESTATGDTITSIKLASVPLNGRNFATLTLLIPGAISTNPGAMNTSNRFQGSGSRPQVNGNREQTNNFLLEGVDVNDSIDNRIGYQPNVDALEEVKVITGNGGGEFGNVGGAIVNMQLKSGTNAFHGNVFEFLRNDKLDANGFFGNRQLQRRGALRRNIFGGTFGGPIQRNKTFFFVDYEGTAQRTAGPSSASVAPQSWRNGDLSDFLTRQNQIIRDPFTGPDLPSRTPFPGNILPGSRITNPAARYLFSNAALYPQPNNPGTGVFGIGGNYLSSARNKTNNHQADAKLDYRLSDKDNITGRWSISRYEQLGSQAALPVFMTSGTDGPTMSSTVNWTRTFTSRLVSDTRIAYSRIGIDDKAIDWSGQLGADGNAKFGIPGGQPIPGLSGIALGNGLSGVGTGASISSTVDNKYQAGTNFSFQTGKHFVKFGGQLLRLQQNRYYSGNNGALGSFTYSGVYSGVNYADFLLNALAGKGRGSVSGKWGHRHWRNALFVQDDFKFSRNLTLNLGLRWEYISPIYEVADRQVNINTYTGALQYPGKDGNNRALYAPYRKQFMPRIGFAYTPDLLKNKLVVRGGYAFTSFLEGTGANLRLPLNPPFFIEADVSYDPRTPGSIATGFADVIARGDLLGPRTGAGGTPFFQARAWDPNLRPQFTNQFNLTLEYQFDNHTSMTVAYVGQRGTHLVVPHEANNPVAGTGPVATWINQNDRRPLARALPNVSNIALTESSGTMWYNSLQVSARRRMSGGIEILASYTMSRTLTDNLGYYGCGAVNAEGAYWQDAYNRHGNWGPACFDARHNFVTGGSYSLPVGKGKKLGSSMSKPLDMIAGGWNLNFYMSTHTGFPVTLKANNHNTGGRTPRGNIRPNRYGKLPNGGGTVDTYFGKVFTASDFCASGVSTGCTYGYPLAGELGNAGVGTERAAGFFDLGGSIGKRFQVREKDYVEFRTEFFNIMNHPSFGPPGNDIGNPAGFGVIGSQVNGPRNIQFGLKYVF